MAAGATAAVAALPARGRALAAAALALAALTSPLPAPAAEPALAHAPDGGVALAALPPVLDRPAVREQLASGLTTSFVFELRPPGLLAQPVGAARVDVRYELWDEVYLVAALGADGERRQLRFDDLAALAAWWRRPALAVAPAGLLPERLRLRLRVLPFSAAEQRDAQAWLTETLADPAGGAAERTDDAAEEGGRPLDRLFRVLLATSIARGSLLEEEWEVALPPRGPPS
jgi:hypothetical protein